MIPEYADCEPIMGSTISREYSVRFQLYKSGIAVPSTGGRIQLCWQGDGKRPSCKANMDVILTEFGCGTEHEQSLTLKQVTGQYVHLCAYLWRTFVGEHKRSPSAKEFLALVESVQNVLTT